MSLKDKISTIKNESTTRQMRIGIFQIHQDAENWKVYDAFNPEEKEEDRELVELIRTLGLLQPLCVKRHPTLPDEFIIVAGHRRYSSIRYLNRLGEYGSTVEVVLFEVETEEDVLLSQLALVKTNSHRNKTQDELAREVLYLNEIYKQLKTKYPERYAGITIREMVAADTGKSERTIATVNKSLNNLTELQREDFKSGRASLEDLKKEKNYIPFNETTSVEKTKIGKLLWKHFGENVTLISNKSGFIDIIKRCQKEHQGFINSLRRLQFNPGELVISLEEGKDIRLTTEQVYFATLWAAQEAGKVETEGVPQPKSILFKDFEKGLIKQDSQESAREYILKQDTKTLVDFVSTLKGDSYIKEKLSSVILFHFLTKKEKEE